MLTPVARISGTKEKRPEIDRLMQDAHRRRFDVVPVWKFDRMARSVSHLLRVLETFDALGIHFVSLSESDQHGHAGGHQHQLYLPVGSPNLI